MPEKYDMKSTSLQSSVLDDKVLDSTSTTRRIIRPEIVENEHDSEAGVKITLAHQRKNLKSNWEDIPTKPLSSLKANEEATFIFSSQGTLNLYRRLEELYVLSSSGGVRTGETSWVVGREDEIVNVGPDRARIINALLKQGYSQDVWDALVETDPDLITKLSYARIHTEREKTLQEFRDRLRYEDWTEPDWQEFFETNTWIFGYGLNYKFLNTNIQQPHVGGTNVTRKGAQRPDFLAITEANVKFSALVEIKRPDTKLFGRQDYRTGVWTLGDELIGGVSQLQINCRTWDRDGSQREENQEILEKMGVYTIQPKGILVIGDTLEFRNAEDSLSKRNTFELFRRNLANPEIITYDELYERAKFIVEQPEND